MPWNVGIFSGCLSLRSCSFFGKGVADISDTLKAFVVEKQPVIPWITEKTENEDISVAGAASKAFTKVWHSSYKVC